MISWISTWAEQLIVAVIIGTIIEMILPNGNSKKYIKVVIGIYILFTIISPILSKFTNIDFKKMDFEKYFNDLDVKQAISYNLQSNNNQTIEELYLNNLKQDIKLKLERKGYKVEKISLNIELEELNYGKINNIWLKLYKKDDDLEKKDVNLIEVDKIDEISIGKASKSHVESIKDETDISSSDKDKIKEYLSNEYEVSIFNIEINE